MAHGAPDWTRQVQIVIVEAQPAEEDAAGDTGRYDGASQTYQEVASWTVAEDKVGELKEITLLADYPALVEWKVTIGEIVFAEDWIVQAAVPLIFEDLRLATEVEVKVEARSTDGSNIIVDAIITGKEIG